MKRITGRVEEHHVASDKAHKNEDARKSLEILANADLKPQSKPNLVTVEDHGVAHGDFYHKIVRERLEGATERKTPHTNEYQDAVRKALTDLKQDILRDGSPLNLATKKPSAGGSR